MAESSSVIHATASYPRGMTFDPSDPNGDKRSPSPDDTAAFQRFYHGEAPAQPPTAGPGWYRALVSWWQRRAAGR